MTRSIKYSTRGEDTNLKVAATLTLHRPSEYSPRGRRQIVTWLKRQIKTLQTEHQNLDWRYTARYYYGYKYCPRTPHERNP